MSKKQPRIATAVMDLEPYVTSNQKPLFIDRDKEPLKLDWNECTIEPSESVKNALTEFVNNGRLNWYPDVEAKELRGRLASFTSLPVDHISCFGGSDMALEYIARTYLQPDTELIMSAPTYDNVRVYAHSTGASVKKIYHDSPFEPRIENLLNAVTSKTRLIYLCNPNNPTGSLISTKNIERLLEGASNIMVVIDEAYIEFSGGSSTQLVRRFGNLMVIRSFSKAFGLANLRLGYVLSAPENLDYLHRIKVGKNLSSLAQVAGIAALEDFRYTQEYIAQINESRQLLQQGLQELGYKFHMTPANFFLLEVADPSEAIRLLEEQMIFVRDRSRLNQLQNCIRITIGTRPQMERLLTVLQRIAPTEATGPVRQTSPEFPTVTMPAESLESA